MVYTDIMSKFLSGFGTQCCSVMSSQKLWNCEGLYVKAQSFRNLKQQHVG